MSALLVSPVLAPNHIGVSDRLDSLNIATADGATYSLKASALRGACKCAHCTRARIDGVFPAHFDGIAITQVSPVGSYAINIEFSDGHARGIYPWTLLQSLQTREG